MRKDLELDEDPDEAMRAILGQARGSKRYAVVCLLDALRHGERPSAEPANPGFTAEEIRMLRLALSQLSYATDTGHERAIIARIMAKLLAMAKPC